MRNWKPFQIQQAKSETGWRKVAAAGFSFTLSQSEVASGSENWNSVLQVSGSAQAQFVVSLRLRLFSLWNWICPLPFLRVLKYFCPRRKCQSSAAFLPSPRLEDLLCLCRCCLTQSRLLPGLCTPSTPLIQPWLCCGPRTGWSTTTRSSANPAKPARSLRYSCKFDDALTFGQEGSERDGVSGRGSLRF